MCKHLSLWNLIYFCCLNSSWKHTGRELAFVCIICAATRECCCRWIHLSKLWTWSSLCEIKTDKRNTLNFPDCPPCDFFCFLELPGPPTNIAISNTGPRSVTLQFKPGYDGKTSISRWQVEAQVKHQKAHGSCIVFLGLCFGSVHPVFV